MSKHYPNGSFAIHNHIDHEAFGLTDHQLAAFFESIAQSDDPDLLFESMSLSELEGGYRADSEPVDDLMLEAITSRRNRLERTMKAFKRALTQSMSGTDIAVSDAEIGKPRKSGVAATMTAVFPFSDGQTISIIFHAPDNDPLKINMDDTLLAFRFLLNKTDVTNVVSPHNGRDISLKQTTMAVSNLVEKNSAKFQEKQAANAERRAELDKLEQDLESETDKQAALADEIDAGESELAELQDRSEHFENTRTSKKEHITRLKAQIAGHKGAKAKVKGTGPDKVALERNITIAKIDALEGRERAKAISKAVKAEFKRIGVTVSAKLQSQKQPLLDVRVKEGNTPIPERTQAIILSTAPHAIVEGTFTAFVTAEEWLKALTLGFDHDPTQNNDSMDQKATLPKHVDELFHDFAGWSYDADEMVKARAELSDLGWAQWSDENTDMAETLIDKVIMSIRNKLFAEGAEYTDGGSQFNNPWPLLVDGVQITMTAMVPYLKDGHWSSFRMQVGADKKAFPFTAETDLSTLVPEVVAEARKQAAQLKVDNEPGHKPDGTKEGSEGVTGGLKQGDKFTSDGMEYTLIEVPNNPDGNITANGGPMGDLGGEQWEGYERFKQATGHTIAQFEATGTGETYALPAWSEKIISREMDYSRHENIMQGGELEKAIRKAASGKPAPELKDITKGQSLEFDDIVFGESGIITSIRDGLRKKFGYALTDDYGWEWNPDNNDEIIKENVIGSFMTAGDIQTKLVFRGKEGFSLSTEVELNFHEALESQIGKIEKAHEAAVRKYTPLKADFDAATGNIEESDIPGPDNRPGEQYFDYDRLDERQFKPVGYRNAIERLETKTQYTDVMQLNNPKLTTRSDLIRAADSVIQAGWERAKPEDVSRRWTALAEAAKLLKKADLIKQVDDAGVAAGSDQGRELKKGDKFKVGKIEYTLGSIPKDISKEITATFVDDDDFFSTSNGRPETQTWHSYEVFKKSTGHTIPALEKLIPSADDLEPIDFDAIHTVSQLKDLISEDAKRAGGYASTSGSTLDSLTVRFDARLATSEVDERLDKARPGAKMPQVGVMGPYPAYVLKTFLKAGGFSGRAHLKGKESRIDDTRIGAEYFDYSQEGTEKVKIVEYRKATENLLDRAVNVEVLLDQMERNQEPYDVEKFDGLADAIVEQANRLILLNSPRAKDYDIDERYEALEYALKTLRRNKMERADAVKLQQPVAASVADAFANADETAMHDGDSESEYRPMNMKEHVDKTAIEKGFDPVEWVWGVDDDGDESPNGNLMIDGEKVGHVVTSLGDAKSIVVGLNGERVANEGGTFTMYSNDPDTMSSRLQALYNKQQPEGESSMFWYGLRARPFQLGAQPAGVLRSYSESEAKLKFPNADSAAIRHGAVAYNQELPADKVSEFELVPLNGSKSGPDQGFNGQVSEYFDVSKLGAEPAPLKTVRNLVDDLDELIIDTEEEDRPYIIDAANKLISNYPESPTDGVKARIAEILERSAQALYDLDNETSNQGSETVKGLGSAKVDYSKVMDFKAQYVLESDIPEKLNRDWIIFTGERPLMGDETVDDGFKWAAVDPNGFIPDSYIEENRVLQARVVIPVTQDQLIEAALVQAGEEYASQYREMFGDDKSSLLDALDAHVNDMHELPVKDLLGRLNGNTGPSEESPAIQDYDQWLGLVVNELIDNVTDGDRSDAQALVEVNEGDLAGLFRNEVTPKDAALQIGKGDESESAAPEGTYAIGDVIWHAGNQLKIKTEPYERYGGEWQDGDVIGEDGEVLENAVRTVPTPRSKEQDVERKKAEWKAQQEQFSRLNENNSTKSQDATDSLAELESNAESMTSDDLLSELETLYNELESAGRFAEYEDRMNALSDLLTAKLAKESEGV